jgi:hypothetical protein
MGTICWQSIQVPAKNSTKMRSTCSGTAFGAVAGIGVVDSVETMYISSLIRTSDGVAGAEGTHEVVKMISTVKQAKNLICIMLSSNDKYMI